MRVITGDECGVLKECLPELGEAKGIRRINAEQSIARKHGVVDLCWIQHQQDKSFASLSIDGVCTTWERTSDEPGAFARYRKRSEIVNIFKNKAIHPRSRPLGLHGMQSNNLLCVCNAAGTVGLVNVEKENLVESFEVAKVTGQDKDNNNHPLITASTVHPDEQRLAVGGNERDVGLWDLTAGTEVWKAKNAKPDPQTLLQQQVWPTAIAFLSSNVVAVGSAHAEIRLYDIRQQRRPIALTPKEMWEHRITTLCTLPNGHLLAGDSAGYLQTMDWRQNLNQIVGRFVGPAGSIRATVSHPEENRLAVAGLDRMLRIYDQSTRKQVYCLYLRQRLNCALFGQEQSRGGETEDGEDTADWTQGDKVEDYIDSSDDEEPLLDGELLEIQKTQGPTGNGANSSEEDASDDDSSSAGDEESEGNASVSEEEEEDGHQQKERKRARY